MAKRMKTPAAPAITSLAELTARVGRFAILSAEIERLEAEAKEAIAAIKASLAERQLPLATEMKSILAAAKPWWAANSDQLTEGKRKSVELAGCLIGERLSKPALAFPKPEEHAINLIEGQAWPALLRVEKELDKPAIMKALAFVPPSSASEAEIDGIVDAMDLRDTLQRFGFSISQREEFFIARASEDAPSSVEVPDEAQQVAA